jgi:hypothetical protein
MKTIRCFITLFFASFFLISGLQAQQDSCYVRLEDASGYTPTAEQLAELEAAACTLIDSFPAEFRDSFRVYDFGFYLHQEVTEGGYPEPFAKKILEVQNLSPYYLLFGKQTDRTGVYSKMWLELNLPKTGLFACMDSFRLFVIVEKLRLIMEENHKINDITSYVKSQVVSIDSLKELVVRFSYLCNFCPNSFEIKTVLLKKGFIGIKCNIETNQSINNNNSNIYNYSHTIASGDDIVQGLADLLGDLPPLNGTSPQGYISDNDNICFDGSFNKCDSAYTHNIEDHDIWVHLWKEDNTQNGILFIRSEFYILIDDPSFSNAIGGGGTGTPTIRENDQTDKLEIVDKFLIIDPIKNFYYIADYPAPLPMDDSEDYSNAEEPPFYLVKQGESLSSIASASNGAFSVEDLIRWNSDISRIKDYPHTIYPGDKLNLFLEAYYDAKYREMFMYGPDGKLTSATYGLMVPLYNNVQSFHFGPTNKIVLGFTKGNPLLLKPLVPTHPPYHTPPPPILPPLQSPSPNWGLNLTYLRAGFIFAFLLCPNTFGNDAPMHGPFHLIDPITGRYYDEDPRPIKDPSMLKYVTYTKFKDVLNDLSKVPKNGKVYAGMSHGYSIPELIVAARDRGHHKNIQGYQKACLDKYTLATLPREGRYNDNSYIYIRGREQTIIDHMGGSWEKIIKTNKGINETRSGNKKNQLGKTQDIYTQAMIMNKHEAPSISWDGACDTNN